MRFYLAAGVTECLEFHAELKTQFGPLIYEPDLYLRFASLRLTPGTVHGLANRYGLLRYERSAISIRREDGPDLISEFVSEGDPTDRIAIRAEPASS